MNKVNYNNILEEIIAKNVELREKPKLLLHSCCAPCSSACIERLKDAFDITVFYYNPNIDTTDEYEKRKEEQARYCHSQGVEIIELEHASDEFMNVIKGYESEKEGGRRCAKCFRLRLSKTAQIAKTEGFTYFATTLTVSPLKNAELINQIGQELEKEKGVKYLVSDFKKKGGYLRSIELSKEYNLYRQNYCGCEFSKK